MLGIKTYTTTLGCRAKFLKMGVMIPPCNWMRQWPKNSNSKRYLNAQGPKITLKSNMSGVLWHWWTALHHTDSLQPWFWTHICALYYAPCHSYDTDLHSLKHCGSDSRLLNAGNCSVFQYTFSALIQTEWLNHKRYRLLIFSYHHSSVSKYQIIIYIYIRIMLGWTSTTISLVYKCVLILRNDHICIQNNCSKI